MATLFTTGDGVYHDEYGNIVDASGRSFLGKRPEILEKIEQLKAEARERAKNFVYETEEKREATKDLKSLREKLDSLREDIFHLRCNDKYLDEVGDLHTFERWIGEADDTIKRLMAYKRRLINARLNRDALKAANAKMILAKDHEATKVIDEMDEVQAKLREPKTRSTKSDDKPKLTGRALAERMLNLLPPMVYEKMAAGKTREEMIQLMLKTSGVTK
jgi:hypothetical protein